MTPVAQLPAVKNGTGVYDGSRPRFETLQAWLKVFGQAEYAVYKKDHAPSDLGYEEWATSVHAHGMYLWHATLDVWEEESSSGEGSDLEPPKLVLRGPPERKPKKPLTNGHGMRRATKTPKSTSRDKSDEPGASGKRRRKPKKQYLSQEIVASDGSDDIKEPTPIVEVASLEEPSPPPAPVSATNGRRKSGGRRKKQFLSEEIIAPEDEDTDAMSLDAVAVAAADATTAFDALALEHHTPVPEAIAKSPKKKPGRKPKKKYLSQEIVTLDDDEDSAPADIASSHTATGSPESSTNSRRGLRARTAAQQRPYSQDARFVEEHLLADSDIEPAIKRSPKPKSTKLAQVSYPDEEAEIMELEPEDEDEELMDYENDTIGLQVEKTPYTGSGRKAHYKGKGRAWKKTSEDEDQDYVSPIKNKAGNQPKRKLGRRKSTAISEDLVREDDDDDGMEEAEQEPVVKEVTKPVKKEPFVCSPAPKAEKAKRKPRRSHILSEEFVCDDSNSEVEIPQEEQKPPPPPTLVQKTPRPKGRPRKSDQTTSSKSTVTVEDDEEEGFDAGSLSVKKATPKSEKKKKRGYSGLIEGFLEVGRMDGVGDEEREGAEVVSPLRKPRKRKSGGEDE
ncbi:hypothetical protein K458DRAFT_486395 [Lentithecium fluviatile CBS 122367]|uniref:Uncharacterized protein n=1 Tax=Lentithecium fluviatile CBS 122367 TaxID=1168545 RepID=A0A6G1J5L4_9PLEO|nr:hypothetical protein K458DRAFT_486395 [Lentithecium fluviatile CBS 122367]